MTTLIIAGVIVLAVIAFVIFLMTSARKAGNDEQKAKQLGMVMSANRARLDAEHDAANTELDRMRDDISKR